MEPKERGYVGLSHHESYQGTITGLLRKAMIGGGEKSYDAQALRAAMFDSADDRAMMSVQLSAMQQ
jgi:hypothetical protein